MERPKTKPQTVDALSHWNPETPGQKIEGAIVGQVSIPEIGMAWVLEDQSGVQFRLPVHVDLDRKVIAARLNDPHPWLEIEYTGKGQDDRTRIYRVLHYPRS